MPNYVNIAWEKHRQSVGRYYGFTYIYKAMGCKRLLFFEKPILQVVHRKKKAQNSKKCSNYFPYGMLMPNRKNNTGLYRYGFGSHEKDDEIKGDGNHYSFGDYGLDVRIGRRLQPDPLVYEFPWQSSYMTFYNNPIVVVDPTGMKGESFDPDEEGNLKTEPGDTVESLAKRQNITKEQAEQLVYDQNIGVDSDGNLETGRLIELNNNMTDAIYYSGGANATEYKNGNTTLDPECDNYICEEASLLAVMEKAITPSNALKIGLFRTEDPELNGLREVANLDGVPFGKGILFIHGKNANDPHHFVVDYGKNNAGVHYVFSKAGRSYKAEVAPLDQVLRQYGYDPKGSKLKIRYYVPIE